MKLAYGRLLTWSFDRTARLWAVDGTPGLVLQGHTSTVRGARQLAGGRLLTGAPTIRRGCGRWSEPACNFDVVDGP